MTTRIKEVRIIVKKQNEYSPWELGYWLPPEDLAEVEAEIAAQAKTKELQEDSKAETEKVEAEE